MFIAIHASCRTGYDDALQPRCQSHALLRGFGGEGVYFLVSVTTGFAFHCPSAAPHVVPSAGVQRVRVDSGHGLWGHPSHVRRGLRLVCIRGDRLGRLVVCEIGHCSRVSRGDRRGKSLLELGKIGLYVVREPSVRERGPLF